MSGAAPDTWAEAFEARLPEVARRAAAPVVDDLIASLEKRRTDSPEDALLDEVEARLDAFDDVREQARRLRQTLRAAEGLGPRRQALIDVLGELSGGRGRRRDRRALRRNLDEEAAEDRIVRKLHEARQPLELICVVLSGSRLREAEAGRVARVRPRLVAIMEDRSLLWVIREAAVRAIGACCTGDGDADAREAVRHMALDATQDPWVQATALAVWLRLTATTLAVQGALSRALLDEREDRHPDHAFFRARAIRLMIVPTGTCRISAASA